MNKISPKIKMVHEGEVHRARVMPQNNVRLVYLHTLQPMLHFDILFSLNMLLVCNSNQGS